MSDDSSRVVASNEFAMEPLLSNLPVKPVRNEPHDLLARLYREIGISAVAAALQVSGPAREISAEARMLLAAPSEKAA